MDCKSDLVKHPILCLTWSPHSSSSHFLIPVLLSPSRVRVIDESRVRERGGENGARKRVEWGERKGVKGERKVVRVE